MNPPYSPELASSDYNPFPKRKHTRLWSESLDRDRYKLCIDKADDYVETRYMFICLSAVYVGKARHVMNTSYIILLDIGKSGFNVGCS